MGSGVNSMPMDGASFPEESPMMDQEPIDNTSMEIGQEEMPMEPNMNGSESAPVEDDSTMGIINQLSSDDKDAVRAYAESLLDKNKNGDIQDNGDEVSNKDGLNMKAPVGGNIAESIIFTKKQLKTIKENINKQK